MLLHIVLENMGFRPLPLLPIFALVASFFYAFHLTLWLKRRSTSDTPSASIARLAAATGRDDSSAKDPSTSTSS
jgi:heme O synthase-like polyprenyltransferase